MSLRLCSLALAMMIVAGICATVGALAAETTPKLQVGAYYYPWYSATRHWKEGYIQTPQLGLYSSDSASVIAQHMDWARAAGIDFLVASWWGPNDFTDRVLQTSYLLNPNPVPLALFYEIKARFQDRRIDFSNPTYRDILAQDFVYMAKRYFSHPAYLRIDGKPVVFIYLTRIFTGDYAAAIKQVRDAVKQEGFDIFIVADEAYWGSITAPRARVFDAVTAYNMHTASLVEDDFAGFLTKVDEAYAKWAAFCALPNSPRFIPNVMPGFNDSGVRPEAHNPKLLPSPERFRSFLELALKYVDPALPMLMVTSFNEWHEDTQIEPSIRFGTAYLDTLRSAVAAKKESAQ